MLGIRPTWIAILFWKLETNYNHRGLRISYSKRAGGPGQFAHACELAPSFPSEDPSDIAKAWDKYALAGALVGRSGLAALAIGAFEVALWDLKAKRAGLSLTKLLGARRDSVRCYNASSSSELTAPDKLLGTIDRSRGISLSE